MRDLSVYFFFEDAGHHVDDVALLYIYVILHMCDVHLCDKAVARFDYVCFFLFERRGASR